MNRHVTHRRVATLGATLALAVGPLATGLAGSTAAAAPARSAATSVDNTYLQDTFPGLPSNTVVETVTYDRFQWLLQQPGQLAFLIGSAADPGFTANVVATDAAARAAGTKKVYWFDPNLSGYSDDRNLDTRDPAGINLAASAQTVFGNTWRNLLGQYLGNGIKSVPNGASVTVTTDDTVVNDSVDPLWDYRAVPAQTPVAASADVFFVYDKDHRSATAADKVLDWTNLSTAADPAAAASGVTADLASVTGGAAAIDAIDQFHWWKDAANSKHKASYPDTIRYGGDILTDADNAEGWRIKQITYPELLHLLDIQDSADKNFVLLFGGTWCHNTRAVLKYVNQQAQDNDVKTVYNFDLVLDGGTTNGTNGGTNPIHVRDNANSGTTTNFRPSYLYGDVVRKYLKNLITEYDPNTGTRVAYYPGGDTTAFPDVVRKLQVPFLVNYQRGTSLSTAVKRQWIQQNTDSSTGLPTFKEYMTEWWFTSRSPQLGLSFSIADESRLSDAEKAQLSQARANVDFAQDGLAKLKAFFGGLPGAVVSRPSVTAAPVAYGTAPSVAVAIANDYGRVPAGNVTLSVGGASYVAKVAQNAASFTLPKLVPGSYPYTVSYAGDGQVVAFQRTGTLTVTRGSLIRTAGAVVKAPTSSHAGRYKVTVTAPAGLATATGKVTVTLTKGRSRKTVVATLAAGTATVTVPKLKKGTWKVKLAYAGDARYTAQSGAGTAVKAKK